MWHWQIVVLLIAQSDVWIILPTATQFSVSHAKKLLLMHCSELLTCLPTLSDKRLTCHSSALPNKLNKTWINGTLLLSWCGAFVSSAVVLTHITPGPSVLSPVASDPHVDACCTHHFQALFGCRCCRTNCSMLGGQEMLKHGKVSLTLILGPSELVPCMITSPKRLAYQQTATPTLLLVLF